MPRIIVSVSNDLLTDQRVEKVCDSLFEEGYDILLLGRKLGDSRPINRKYQTKRIKLVFNKGPLFYAELNLRLFFKILSSKADILLANDLDTLLANYCASRFKKVKLVYDSHEYFTEVPELQGRFARKIWLRIEKSLFPRIENVYTVGRALANIYSAKYDKDVKVVRNVPRRKERVKIDRGFLLYQGAINEGRGIVELLEAIKETGYSLKIAGSGDLEKEVQEKIMELKLGDRVEYLGRLKPEELHELTCQAHIGFNLLSGDSPNYYFSLANKFFDYIQAQVPVVTMRFPEYESIFQEYKVGALIENLQSNSILKALQEIEENQENIVEELKRASEEFTWEKEAKQLKAIFANLDQ